MSSREDILSAIVVTLKGIKKASLYNTDLGDYVYSWRVDKIGTDVMYMADVRDVRIERAEKSESYNFWDWWIYFDIVVIANTLENLRLCVEDVYTCLGHNSNLGGKVIYLEQPESDSIEVIAEEKTYYGCLISLRGLYRTEIWKQ